MRTTAITLMLFLFASSSLHAQHVYVDSNTGKDSNQGTALSPFYSIKKAAEVLKAADNMVWTIKVNPGIYVLDHVLSIDTEKEQSGKRIVIEASVLPDDPDWKPELMPVIFSVAPKGEIPDNFHFVASFLVNESHVTFRGLKFTGYAYPNTRYFPIARFNKETSDLYVEQCLFVGDEDAFHLQVGIIAHGDGIRADHCVFYKVRNSIVFWEASGEGSKRGNGISNSIIYGATQSGIWTASPDEDFVFKNNVVSDCKFFWVTNESNPTLYTIDNCIVVNSNYQAIAGSSGVVAQKFDIEEKEVIKKGKISLRQKSEITHYDLPIDYLHVIPGTPGYELGAGLFKRQK